MFAICKELVSGARKLIPITDLLLIDWKKMTYSPVPVGHSFKRRTDYGRLKQSESDDEPYVYKYWVIETAVTEEAAKATLDSGKLRMPAYSCNGREKLPISQFNTNSDKEKCKKTKSEDKAAKRKGQVNAEESIVKKLKSQNNNKEMNSTGEDSETPLTNSNNQPSVTSIINTSSSEISKPTEKPLTNSNKQPSGTSIINTSSSEISKPTLASTEIADVEEPEEVSYVPKTFISQLVSHMNRFLESVDTRFHALEKQHDVMLSCLEEQHEKQIQEIMRTFQAALGKQSHGSTLQSLELASEEENSPVGYVNCGSNIMISDSKIYEIWVTESQEPLRSKLVKMVHLMFPNPEQRCYMYVKSDIPAKETERDKCSIFPAACVVALKRVANSAAEKILQRTVASEQNRYLAKNPNVPEDQRQDRLSMIRQVCEENTQIYTEQDIRAQLSKVLEYERKKRVSKVSNNAKQVPDQTSSKSVSSPHGSDV